jgi:uncharacterized protein (TIGR00730 family)
MIGRICVFAGSSRGVRHAFAAAARQFGRVLADHRIGLVYGGGGVGLMGVVADAALAGGGEVVGVIPRAMATRELAHAGLTEMRVVETMHERKAQMARLADAFVALPGGLGTFDELFEILTWAQLGLHDKPIGLLDVDGYFAPLLALVEHAAAEGFIPPRENALTLVEDEPERLVERLLAYEPVPLVSKYRWITEEQA